MASSFLSFLDHTQRRTTIGRTPLDEWSARRRDLYLTTHNTHNRQISMPPGGIRTHDLIRRAAADLRLRPRGYWDRRPSEETPAPFRRDETTETTCACSRYRVNYALEFVNIYRGQNRALIVTNRGASHSKSSPYLNAGIVCARNTKLHLCEQ